MGYEVEVKYRVADHEALADQLVGLGADPGAPIDQADVYLAHPSRDFSQTHEAFRIRRQGDDNRLTYKGPKHGGPTKTRQEIEIGFNPGEKAFEQMEQLCHALGFRPVAIVRKSRRPFHITIEGVSLEVTLDNAAGLGTFAEVEALAESEDDLPRAQAAVLALGTMLGLTDVEPRSYLRMLLSL